MPQDTNKLAHKLTFTGLEALLPCVLKACVTVIAALVEPSTVTATTTEPAQLLDNAALGAPCACSRRCSCRRGFF